MDAAIEDSAWHKFTGILHYTIYQKIISIQDITIHKFIVFYKFPVCQISTFVGML